MKAPVTQEEIDYRSELTNKINAISSIQGLFTDIEDKPRRLRILKTLLSALNYGDALNAEIDAEIRAIEEAAAQAEEEEDAAETEDASDTAESGGEDIDLGSLDALEALKPVIGDILLEEHEFSKDELENVILTEDELPTPSDLDREKDFSENN